MPTPPTEPPELAYVQKLIEQLSKVYGAAADRIQALLNDALLTNVHEFRYSEQLRQIKAIVAALNVQAKTFADKGIPPSYTEGVDFAAKGLAKSGVDVSALNLGNRVNTAAVQAIAEQVALDLIAANQSIETNARRILRSTQQTLIENGQIDNLIAQGVIQGETRRATSARLAARLREQLTGKKFVTAGSHNFKPEYYAEIVTLTKTREAVTQGVINTATEFGVDLFQASVHTASCPICLPFQGRVYSLSGADGRFPKLDMRPPYHPRCRHVLVAFVLEAYSPKEIDQHVLFTASHQSVGGLSEFKAVIQAGGRAA